MPFEPKPNAAIHCSPDMLVFATLAAQKVIRALDPSGQRRMARECVVCVAGSLVMIDHRGVTHTMLSPPVGVPLSIAGIESIEAASNAAEVVVYW
jgi:hypothetical protein